MKVTSLSALTFSMIASCVFARPRPGVLDDTGLVPQKSRVTAFLKTDSGTNVECWEIGSSDKQGVRLDTTEGPAQTYVLVFQSHARIDFFSLGVGALGSSSSPSLFTITSGLFVGVQAEPDYDSATATSPEQYVFSAENGDNWFYFEDLTTASGRAKAASQPLKMSTASATESTVIQFKYETAPEHKVLHKNGCRFAGLKDAVEDATDEDLAMSCLTVQEKL